MDLDCQRCKSKQGDKQKPGTSILRIPISCMRQGLGTWFQKLLLSTSQVTEAKAGLRLTSC
eukprot:scaffold132924_cov16-Tisochrysis_lutea.AAC.2